MEILPLRAMHLLRAARLTGCGAMVRAIVVIHQRIHAGIGLQIDAATTATVASIGAAFRGEFLAAEVGGPITAMSCLHIDFGAIKELHMSAPLHSVHWPQ